MEDAGLESTLQHIGMLDARRRRIVEAQTEAEEQLFHRVGVMWDKGDLAVVDLVEIYDRCHAIRSPGMSARWDAQIDIPWRSMKYAARQLPNGPEGTWVGVVPVAADDSAPPGGQPVVYVLFGADNEPCYVGSTADLRARLKGHLKDGKRFVRWQAYGCLTREAAYALEERLLRDRLPRLNRKVGR